MNEISKRTKIDKLATVLDSSIPLGRSGHSIGLDPLIGLIPGVGDAIGAALSTYIIWEAARLGVSRWVLARMIGNVALESFIGVIPVVGDLFDMAYKANQRNVRLLQGARTVVTEASGEKRLLSTLVIVIGTLILIFAASIYLTIRALGALFG